MPGGAPCTLAGFPAFSRGRPGDRALDLLCLSGQQSPARRSFCSRIFRAVLPVLACCVFICLRFVWRRETNTSFLGLIEVGLLPEEVIPSRVCFLLHRGTAKFKNNEYISPTSANINRAGPAAGCLRDDHELCPTSLSGVHGPERGKRVTQTGRAPVLRGSLPSSVCRD